MRCMAVSVLHSVNDVLLNTQETDMKLASCKTPRYLHDGKVVDT